MTLDDLKAALDDLGIILSARLSVDAPHGVMTPEIKTALDFHKPTLLLQLARTAEWERLRAWRWGPAADDPTPGIVIDHPDSSQKNSDLKSMESESRPLQ